MKRTERLFYIIREDGSSIFDLPYREDYIFHCLLCLSYRTDEKFRLLQFSDENSIVLNIIPISSVNDILALNRK